MNWRASVFLFAASTLGAQMLPLPGLGGTHVGGSKVPALISHTINSSSASTVTTDAINTTGATLLVVVVNCWLGTLNAPTSSPANTWSVLYSAGGGTGYYYSLSPVTSASQTFSVVNSGSGYNHTIAVMAFNGVSVLDTSAASTDTQPGSITPAANGELLISMAGGFATPVAPTVNSGFTILDSGNYVTTSTAWQVQGTAAPINPTWTWDDEGYGRSVMIAAFK
jgi:hypothetical protein